MFKAKEILTYELYQKMKNNDEDISWHNICKCYALSEDIIREFKYKFNWWGDISIYQNLSEDSIREFKNYVSWASISTYQVLSESFIREFKNRIYWEMVSIYQNISYEFIIEFVDEIDLYDLKQNKYLQEKLTEHQWRTIEFLKKTIN